MLPSHRDQHDKEPAGEQWGRLGRPSTRLEMGRNYSGVILLESVIEHIQTAFTNLFP